MLKATDKKGKKALLVFDSSSDSEEDDSKKGKAIKKGKTEKGSLFGKGNKNGQSQTASEGFTINKGYADRYDNWRNLEEMQKLKNRLGINDISELNEEGSSSESSSEGEDDFSTEKERAFLRTLACLKTKNPKIYNDKFGFFEDAETASRDNDVTKSSKTKEQGKKPFTVRDHERTMILEKAGTISDDDDDNDKSSRSKLKSYPEELASIKTEFSKALNEIDSSDDEEGDGDLLGSNLLKRRTNKSAEEKEREDEDYKLWLKGELQKVEKGKLSKEEEKEFKSLREYWNDDKLDEGEKFLRDYILNKKYIDPLKASKDYIPSYSEVIGEGDGDLSDDEKFEAEREEFEHKYNFRFEEPDQDFIKRYPRTIQESLRREDTKRKEQRQKVKDRKEEVKERKKEEVQRLKALKRKEIMDKIQKLHEISGDPSLALSEVDIDGDFDPEEYDRRMQQIFSDNYYQEEADEEKPVFEYDPEIDDEENWEKWVPPRGDDSEEIEVKQEEIEDLDDEDENDVSEHKKEEADFFGRQQRRAAVQQEMIDASKSKRGRKKKQSAFLEALEREKPKFDPKVHKSFEKYFEEYYKLDFEDIVGGDVKCRFKYHKTTPNDFGLTTEEILKAEDKELNQWASLKKTFQYRGDDEEQYEVKAYKKKAEQEDLKKRVLVSVYQPKTEDKTAEESDSDEEQEKQKKKRKKKNKKKNKTQDNTNSSEVTSTETAITDEVTPTSSPPAKKGKKNSSQSPEQSTTAKVVKKQESNVQSPIVTTPPSAKLSKRQRKNRKKLDRSENNSATPTTTTTASSPVKNPVKKSAGQKESFNNKGNKTKRYFDKDDGSNNNNKRGLKRKAAGANETNEATKLDDDRLRSYGLNPKKFKKQIKYGNSAKV